jgi:hypothetical protein
LKKPPLGPSSASVASPTTTRRPAAPCRCRCGRLRSVATWPAQTLSRLAKQESRVGAASVPVPFRSGIVAPRRGASGGFCCSLGAAVTRGTSGDERRERRTTKPAGRQV